MNKKEIFKEIIKTFQEQPPVNVRKRKVSLPVNSGKIITVSGIRRSGKTYLLLDTILSILPDKSKRNIVYINFEDERLDGDKKDLDLILGAYRELYPDENLRNVYFFFDEIQNIEGWEKFVRRVYDNVSRNIFVTGSNSAFLSTDIFTALRGRTLNFEVYPLSFSEYLSFSNMEADIYNIGNKAKIVEKSREYLSQGGFPEICFLDKNLHMRTLQEYFNVMLFKDIIERYKRKSHSYLLKYFVKRLLSCISMPVSIHKIYNELKSQGYKIDKNLLYHLLAELNSVYFFFPLHKYNFSAIKREKGEKKIYIADNGLANAISFNFSENKGVMLENAVFMQFRSNGSQIYFYKNKKECDFIRVTDGGKKEAYQVCCDLTDELTRRREIDGLIEACHCLKIKKGYLITLDEEFERTISGVKIKAEPFYKWALRFNLNLRRK